MFSWVAEVSRLKMHKKIFAPKEKEVARMGMHGWDGWMEGWMDGMDEWMDEWMGGWVDGWMDG